MSLRYITLKKKHFCTMSDMQKDINKEDDVVDEEGFFVVNITF